MYKKSHFGGQFEKQHGKRAQTLIDQCEGNKIGKNLLVVCKILGLFVKTLSVCRKFSLLNRDKLRQSIQMQLCKKQKAFS